MARSELKLDPLVEILADMIISALQWEAEHHHDIDGEDQSETGLTGAASGVDYLSPIPRPLPLRLRENYVEG